MLIEEGQLLYICMYLGLFSLIHILQDQGSSKRTQKRNGVYLSPSIAYRSPYVDLIWALRLTLCPMVGEFIIFICQNYIELHHGMHVIKALTCLFGLREGLLTLSFQCSATALGGLRLLRPILSHSCKLLDPKGPSTNRRGCETALMINDSDLIAQSSSCQPQTS